MELQKRNKRIRDFHKKGHAFSEIANWDWVGLSPERVRQICLDTEDKTILAAEMLSKYKHFLVTEDDYGILLNQIAALSNHDRSKDVVLRRQLLIRHLHDRLGLSFFKIALLLKRHHTSISNLYYEK